MGGLILGKLIEKTGLHKRMALRIIMFTGEKPRMAASFAYFMLTVHHMQILLQRDFLSNIKYIIFKMKPNLFMDIFS